MPMDILPAKMCLNRSQQTGLTLVEVLIALAITGIAMTAIIKATSQNISGTSYLQDKMIATWVGMQIMSEARMGLIEMSSTEKRHDKINMLGRDWYWQASIDDTANDHIQKIAVDVFVNDKEASPLISLESYHYHAG